MGAFKLMSDVLRCALDAFVEEERMKIIVEDPYDIDFLAGTNTLSDTG